MAKSETLSETRQKFEEWAEMHLGDERYLIRDDQEPDKYDVYLMDHLWLAWQAGRLQGLEEAGTIRTVMLEALNSCLSSLQMECEECYGECPCADPCTQCRAKSAIKLAEAAAIRERANG